MPSFQTNPSSVDLKENTILFAHCTLPLNMAQKYTLTTHFESGLGIGIKGEMPLGKVSVVKIAPSLKADDSVTFYGTIKRNLSLPNFCRTQIEVEADENGLISLYKDSFGNHMIITYADCVGSFYTLLHIYDDRYEKKHPEEKK
jgi:L-fucose isomerase-like protein